MSEYKLIDNNCDGVWLDKKITGETKHNLKIIRRYITIVVAHVVSF